MTLHESPTNIPDPEVVPNAKRHKFSAAFEAQWRREQALVLDQTENRPKNAQSQGATS
jgi:hypothetical protein